MGGICEGRVAIVTGAGTGLGRSHALELARQGARVIVNDLGTGVDGAGHSGSPASKVAEEIHREGGIAVANFDDVATWRGAEKLVRLATGHFGRLDAIVNNAGIVRDRMLVKMSYQEWDAVIRVHLRGTFAVTHWAAAYWRQRKKSGETNDARVINTTSRAGLYGNVGQLNYSAAKAGIAALTIVGALELERYGVTVNAIAPAARTRMTKDLGYKVSSLPVAGEFDRYDPGNVSPVVAWLVSAESAAVTGQVLIVSGGRICVAEGWRDGPAVDKGARWSAAELGGVLPDLVRAASTGERVTDK